CLAWSRVVNFFSSVVEDRQVEEAESLRVVEEIELDDLAVPDGDGGDRERLAVEGSDQAANAVDQRRPDVRHTSSAVAERLARDRLRAVRLLCAAGRAEVGPHHAV